MAEPATRIAPNRFQRRRQQNRAALIEAAWELFQRQGLRATRIEEICERADVSTRTFFNHFETREDLYLAIAEMRSKQFAEIIDRASLGPGDFGDRLAGLLGTLGVYLKQRPAYRELVAAMMGLTMERGAEIARSRTLGRAVFRFVDSAVSRGELASPHPTEILVDILLGTLVISLANWFASDEYDPEREMAAAVTVLLDLFRPRDPSSAGA